jgi:hypothetical protein
MWTLIVILIGLSIIFTGCGKRDIISGLPVIDKKEKPVLETMPDRILLQTVLLLGFGAMTVYVTVLLTEKHRMLLCKRFSWVNRWLGDSSTGYHYT